MCKPVPWPRFVKKEPHFTPEPSSLCVSCCRASPRRPRRSPPAADAPSQMLALAGKKNAAPNLQTAPQLPRKQKRTKAACQILLQVTPEATEFSGAVLQRLRPESRNNSGTGCTEKCRTAVRPTEKAEDRVQVPFWNGFLKDMDK